MLAFGHHAKIARRRTATWQRARPRWARSQRAGGRNKRGRVASKPHKRIVGARRRASNRGTSLVTRLKQLHPQEFENLTYDILFLSGVQNLRWRPPSADGGRDLEGDVAT